MKPTRNIVKPMPGVWKPHNKLSIWAIKNDDDQLGMGENHEGEKKASKNISKITKGWKNPNAFLDDPRMEEEK
jgi:hypothetical protein